MHKVSRSQFYEHKRAFQQYGLEALIDKLPLAATHPNAIDNKTGPRIIELSLKHPAFGKQHRGGYRNKGRKPIETFEMGKKRLET